MAIFPYAKDSEKHLEYFNDYKLKVYLPTVSPKMVLGDFDNTGNPMDPVISIGPVTKKEKFYRQVVIMMTTLMKKATTTL